MRATTMISITLATLLVGSWAGVAPAVARTAESEGIEDGLGPERATAVTSVDDVELRLTLERSPLVAGQPTWATTKITNEGQTPIRYSTDGCEIAVGLRAALPDEQWRSVQPTNLEAIHAEGRNEALDFRWRAQEWTEAGRTEINLGFVPRRFIGQGDIGCLDIGIGHRVPPGESVLERHHWDGQASGSFGPPPGGLAQLTGSFSFRRPGTPGAQTIEVHLDVQVIEGRDPELLHPMEAVDAALEDADFRELIDGVNLGHRAQEMIVFDEARGVWVVGACTDGRKWQGNWRAAAIVDGSNGKVRRVLERVTGRLCSEGPWRR